MRIIFFIVFIPLINTELTVSGFYITNGKTKDCPYTCNFIDRNESSDVIVYDVTSSHAHVPTVYPKNQIRIAYFWESIKHYPFVDKKYNYIVSYRKDSDFPCYHMIESVGILKELKLLDVVPYQDKIKNTWMSVWISNCFFEKNDRRRLWTYISQKISTSSYGLCNRDTYTNIENLLANTPNYLRVYANSTDVGNSKVGWSSQHLFLLAAENSNCKFYHTEKLFHAFHAGTVPIYLGADTIDDYVPKHSIIKVSDFKNIHALIRYIKKVATNQTLYEEYLEWRKHPLPKRYTDKIKAIAYYGSDEWKCDTCTLFHKHTDYYVPIPEC